MTQSYEQAFFCTDESGTEIGIDRNKFEFALTVIDYMRELKHPDFVENPDFEGTYKLMDDLWVQFTQTKYYALDQSFLQCVHDFCLYTFVLVDSD